MSKLKQILDECKTRLETITAPVAFLGRVVIADDEGDLIDLIKQVTSPAIGIVYEGLRSQPENKPSENKGLSAEVTIAFVVVITDTQFASQDAQRVRAMDCLEAMRNEFLGTRSTIAIHKWHFLVEAAADLKAGTTCWVQRWSVPVQLPPR